MLKGHKEEELVFLDGSARRETGRPAIHVRIHHGAGEDTDSLLAELIRLVEEEGRRVDGVVGKCAVHLPVP